MNFVDKVVNYFDPIKGMKRQGARAAQKYIAKASGYSDGGASHTKRSLKGYLASSFSPKEDIDANLDTLRVRSRNLYMTSPIATSALKTTRTNVIGSGLKLKARIDYDFLGLTDEEAEEWESTVEREFALWADTQQCDALNINNFYEIQSLFFMGMLMNGDGFCLRKYANPTPMMPYGLRLQLIESDRVCTPIEKAFPAYGSVNSIYAKADNGNDIYNGVEINSNGEVVAYYICNQFPSSQVGFDYKPYEWNRVEVYGNQTGLRNVLHSFESERAEQLRGVPMLAPVIESLKQLTRYTEAEITAAVISGMFSVFIKVDSPTTEMPIGEAIPGDEEEIDHSESDYQLGVGTINVLDKNESIQIADPKRPIVGFDRFVNAMAKQIGSAIEIPQQLLLKEFNASYSASRASLLEAWKMFKMRRELIAKNFCQPIYEMFLTEAIARGRIKANGFFTDPSIRKAWCGADWNGPAQGMIDPTKEVAAAKERVAEGFSTREEETMGLTGGDFIKNAKQLKRENRLIQDALDEKVSVIQKQKANTESVSKVNEKGG